MAWAADTPQANTSTRKVESIVVRILLNTEDKGDFFVALTPDADYLVKRQDLKSLGFKYPQGSIVVLDGEPYLSLRSMRDVMFGLDEKTLSLGITAQPELLESQALQLRSDTRIQTIIPREKSAFFNYALSAAQDSFSSASRLDFSGEVGVRLGDYLVLTNGNTRRDANGQQKFIRLFSSVTYDDRENLQRTVIGDFFTPAREFSTGVNLGGISFSKLYGLNPYLTRSPTQSISGSVATPSDLEVYLDGQRIRTAKIKPGGFELQELLAYGGARNVQVVLRDAFGRVEQFNYSFYFSDQPLQQGLHEYSYNLGALRRDFGLQSNHYGPAAFSAFHRYGLSNAVTVGVRAEGTKDFVSAGPLVSLVLGNAGIVNAALTTSSFAGQTGAAGLVSYSYQSRFYSLGMSLRREWGNYASLGDPPTPSNRQHEASLVGSYYLQRYGSVSLSHSVLNARMAMAAGPSSPAQPFSTAASANRRVTSLSYNAPLISGRASLQASWSRVSDGQSSNEFFAGLIYFLDKDYSLASSFRTDSNNRSQLVQFTKIQPVGEGLGYILSADRASSTYTSLQAGSRLQYNAPAAILQAEVGQRREFGVTNRTSRVSVAGGLASVDGQLAIGRPVTESFGLVKVGELAGVAVAVNGQPIGKTDANGQVFVPTLAAYFDNDVSISAENVPIDYAIPATVKRISPSFRGGAVIDFQVTKIQAFSGHLRSSADGVTKPLELQEIQFLAGGKKQTLQTGRGGEFYVENLAPGSYPATVTGEGKTCYFNLVVPRSVETFVALGDFICAPGP